MLTDPDVSEIYNKTRKNKITATIILISLLSSLLLISGITDDDEIPKLNDDPISNLPIYGNVSDFTLTNVNNQSYTFSQDLGKIRIVNFFYTKCPGDEGCSLLTLQMWLIYSKIRQSNDLDKVNFVSIDFDYINDTLEDLQEYANSYPAESDSWQFLIGNKTEIDKITDDWNFYFNATQSDNPLTLNHGDEEQPDPYDHSLIVYIIDQQNRIRKFLLGENWTIDEAISTIEFLIEENNSITKY
ncbi:MAG: hypothetical protein HeimC2_23800 [Candidatus Heimdallarchaeota archaeon LC_2]|nr:MAG: hypothetical protein HeimC2_23800 [Candidatus Heimdallarchaeota archaeon LC_2]